MKHYYEKNIVEIKNEYTEFLINILSPLIYEGIKSIYEKAQALEAIYKKSSNNPGILKIFQICLKDIPNLNKLALENETNRIKEKSKCSEWFDALLMSVIKSNIILLTFNAKNKSNIIEEKHHEKIDTSLFIHKCYIECSKVFYNCPEIFWHNYAPLEIKKNQKEIFDIIKNGIKEAIRKSLPIKLILDEYLTNDIEIESDRKYIQIKSLIDKDNESIIEHEHSVNSMQDKHHEIIHERYNSHGGNNHNHQNVFSLNKIIDSDEQQEIEEEMKNLDNEIKSSEKIEKESDLLTSQISQSVDINNLALNTSIEEDNFMIDNLHNGEEMYNKNISSLTPKHDNEKNNTPPSNKKIIEVNFDKKNDMRFFKDEMNKHYGSSK